MNTEIGFYLACSSYYIYVPLEMVNVCAYREVTGIATSL
jgi:hypothetical protein